MSTYRIGIDAGGTKVAYGLFDEENRLLDRFQQIGRASCRERV